MKIVTSILLITLLQGCNIQYVKSPTEKMICVNMSVNALKTMDYRFIDNRPKYKAMGYARLLEEDLEPRITNQLIRIVDIIYTMPIPTTEKEYFDMRMAFQKEIRKYCLQH